jgi:hypothetical protein
MSLEQFNQTFRDEHRQLRDMLLGLIDAFESNDAERVREGVEEMAAHAAPHFEYEGEALYPALAEVHGEDYVEKLLDEHAQAIAAAQQLAEIAEQEHLDEETLEYGAELVRQLLPHVSDRDGLAVMIEVLEPKAIEKIHKAQKESKKRGVSLATLSKGAKKRAAKIKKTQNAAKTRKVVAAPSPSAKAGPKVSRSRPAKTAARGKK